MAKDSSTFTLRLSADQQRQVKELSDQFKVGEAQIIRWGVDALIEYVERHNGHLHLPIDFDALWTQLKATAPNAKMLQSAMLAEEPAKYGSKKERSA